MPYNSTHICVECQKPFLGKSCQAERCPSCRVSHEVAMRRERQKRHYAAHKDSPEFMDRRKAISRLWRETHPEEAKASSSRHRATHAEEGRQQARAWRAAHPEQCRAYARKWRSEHPDEYRRQNKKQYAKRRAARLKGKGRDGNAVMSVLERADLLQECPRLHVRAMSLPCGERPECFGGARCKKCPTNAMPPSERDAPWAKAAMGW